MMKRIFTLLTLLFIHTGLFAQGYLAQKGKSHSSKKINFNGQWKGGFDENSGGIPGIDDDIKYVLELTVDGSLVSGYSYTYFREGPKRYYTICRITGTVNHSTNDIIITEIERTKFNTPPDFQNCFQTHRLHYERDTGNIEVLRGTWIPAPNQGRGCGSGTTVLSRRVVNPLPVGFLPKQNKTTAKATPKKSVPQKPANTHPSAAEKTPSQKPKIQIPDKVENAISKNEIAPPADNEKSKSITPPSPSKGFENRRTNILKTINIEQPTFRLDFYDNGEIDGDSITVFYNGKIVLSNKRLSDKPITLNLSLDKNVKENTVTMYADNLGSIPPNTALMIVTDGNKRYEVRMESDYGKSGTVIFKHDD
jgi:hypothetical protein